MNLKKLLLVFLVLVGSAQKASAESFEDCVFDVVKSRAVGVAASLALGSRWVYTCGGGWRQSCCIVAGQHR